MSIAGNINSTLQNKVLKVIRTNHLIDYGDGVVVGVSGGPDSVCLLHILHSISKVLNIRLYAVHINHMLRGDEADGDEDYTSDLCKKLDIPLTVIRIEIYKVASQMGVSVEEAGRTVRYREFDRVAAEVGAKKIAVAHNKNDQAETVMMHIVRGSGIKGLIGMELSRGKIIRPLLNVYRSEIEQYCKDKSLVPRIDSSNLKSDFSRNKIRLELFPFIDENFNSNITESLCRLSEHALEDNDYLEQCAAKAYEECISECGSRDCVELNIDKLINLHKAIKIRVIQRAVLQCAGSINGIGSSHLYAISTLANRRITGTIAELPGGIRAAVSYEVLRIYKEKKSMDQDKSRCGNKSQYRQVHNELPVQGISLPIPGDLYVQELGATVRTSVVNALKVDNYNSISYNSLVQFFDYELLKRGINIRNRNDGDIFKPIKSNGTKKLKEYFIDNKIPREVRSNIPLICIGNEVIWIIGYKISDKFKVTENTKSIVRIEFCRR